MTKKTKLMKIMRRLLVATLAGTMLFTLAACDQSGGKSSETTEAPTPTTPTTPPTPDYEDMNVGEIKIKLFPEVAPIAVQNFINLTEQGYYDGKLVHRIIKNFMFQGGSPFGDGMGDPNYTDWFSIEPSDKATHIYGALAMANAGPDRNSQQFYVVNSTTGGALGLDGGYTVFGQTLEGFDVIDAVSSVKLAGESPINKVIIESITINTFEGGEDPDSDSIVGNVGGEVKLENGDTYAIMKIRYTE